MGQIPSLKRIVIEEFPAEHRKWLANLIDPLNSFISTVYQNLNRGLTFTSNIQSQIKDLDFYYSAVYPTKENPIEFKNAMPSKPIGIIPLQIQVNASDPAVISSAVTLDWYYDGSTIKIRNITGLTSGTDYKLKVLVIGG